MSMDTEYQPAIKTTFVQMVGPVEILLVTIGGDSVGEYDALCQECDDHAAMAASRSDAVHAALLHWSTEHDYWC